MLGAPSGAVGAAYGVQSGSESLMSKAILPRKPAFGDPVMAAPSHGFTIPGRCDRNEAVRLRRGL
ncbi:Uncharacterised protein [Mycobacteroides abscessus subsp. massiliense]|uniref:Uncharacterized protein n=1 Tax=Mycobacteroides abscessus TaxID=36809 RepID=A0A0U0ZVI1_9MYCO|nr:hypothetical protein D2E33_17810 [Mycobacteroides abscessus]SKM65797.1 Uncharacterised protein [Mycobacteroides abscessus subsp. massiliense]SKT95695.1 Uncharacterised protein [Mycobacteroides abscessus subsp. abscessus]RIT70267.1 hypothetical protein D2E87_07380 [Mycobacteroides abscessus]CPV71166.1 Uncharacterised protein [Mycobacteroides abscessus]